MTDTPPFRPLGYLSGVYYYYSRGEQAVVALQAGGHGKKNLYRLAPHSYWVNKYPVTKKDDFDENAVASALMDECQRVGIFSIKNIRGRGVWMDNNDPVIHFGDKVLMAGKYYIPHETMGKMIYELAESLGHVERDPLSDDQGAKFQSLISQLRWQTPDQHIWFTGWLVCALMGGALKWRPHIWLTGGPQSGKSTLSVIIAKVLGNNCLYIKSVSTEAGIRQTLKADCLPVVMDEAEREDAASHSRIQSILTLARQSSSDDDSRIVKGTPSGTALNYQIRSPFCLSSINSDLKQTADKGRFTNIELSGNKLSGEVYDKWKLEIDALLSSEYVTALYARIFAMVPVIAKNARTLAQAIERKTSDRRLGDQYGALLAGYLSLNENTVLTEADAKWEADNISFAEEKEKANGLNDMHRLLNKILQHVVRIPKEHGYEDVTLGEICERLYKNHTHTEYKRTLANTGIKIIGDNIAIANDNDMLAGILEHTIWPSNWAQTLKRIEYASQSDGTVYFSPSCKERAVLFPINKVLCEDELDKTLPEPINF